MFGTTNNETSTTQPTGDVKKARDNFMVDMRRTDRQELINKRRYNPSNIMEDPQENSMQKINLDHLNNVPWGEEMKPVIQEMLEMQVEVSQFNEFIKHLEDVDRIKRHRAIIGLRKCLSLQTDDVQPPIQETIDNNIVPLLVQMMRNTSEPHIQIESTWCITNMASGTTEQVASLVEKGIIPIVSGLLNTDHFTLLEQSVWCVGNIAGDCSSYRDKLLHSGAQDSLSAKYFHLKNKTDQKNKSLVRQIIWSISNLCRSKPVPDYKLIKNAIPVFCDAIKNETEMGTLADICWALVQHVNKYSIQTIIQLDVIPVFVKMLQLPQIIIVNPVLRMLGNITHGKDEDTQAVIDAGCITCLTVLLNHPHKIIRMEACWIISNITAGTSKQIQCIMNDEFVFPKLVSLCLNDVGDVQREAVWAICNMTKKASPEQITWLMQNGIIDLFDHFLEKKNQSGAKIINVVQEAIIEILNCGKDNFTDAAGNNKLNEPLLERGIVEKIEDMQLHQNESIYKKALRIQTEFFEEEDVI